MLVFLNQLDSATSPPRSILAGCWGLRRGKGVRTVGRLHPSKQGRKQGQFTRCYIENKQVALHSSELTRVINTVVFDSTSDRGKRSLADVGPTGSLATFGEDSGSDRDKRSLGVSAPPRVSESETAFADLSILCSCSCSTLQEVAREINTFPFGLRLLNHLTDTPQQL